MATRVVRPLLIASAVATAACIAVSVVDVNLRAACDAQEWGAPACASRTPDTERQRLRTDIGDAFAWDGLARMQEPLVHGNAVLDSALQLAPREPNLLLVAARAAATAQAWPEAVRLLVEIANHNDDSRAPAALARIIAAGQGRLLVPYLQPGARWLRLTLNELRSVPGGLAAGVPLIAEAVRARAIVPDQLKGDILALREQGGWLDAYSLWVATHPGGVPILYNGSFGEALNSGAFNWEYESRGQQPGARLERIRDESGSHALDINFTGRLIKGPLLRQYVFVGAGRYRLAGELSASRLQLEHGLEWSLRCVQGSAAIRLGPLPSSQGDWLPYTLDFTVPPECGNLASLELRLDSDMDEAPGGTGRVTLRAMSMVRLVN